MTDFLAMSPDEILAEKQRRDARRARGLSLTPDVDEPEEIERTKEEDARQERAIQLECRKKYLGFGCVVYNLSQARASKQTAGLGDLYVISERTKRAWWHEVKTPRGYLSHAQAEFLRMNLNAGIAVVVGGVKAAEDYLIHVGAAYRAADGSLETTATKPLQFKTGE